LPTDCCSTTTSSPSIRKSQGYHRTKRNEKEGRGSYGTFDFAETYSLKVDSLDSQFLHDSLLKQPSTATPARQFNKKMLNYKLQRFSLFVLVYPFIFYIGACSICRRRSRIINTTNTCDNTNGFFDLEFTRYTKYWYLLIVLVFCSLQY
jgi:hypothetical protein